MLWLDDFGKDSGEDSPWLPELVPLRCMPMIMVKISGYNNFVYEECVWQLDINGKDVGILDRTLSPFQMLKIVVTGH